MMLLVVRVALLAIACALFAPTHLVVRALTGSESVATAFLKVTGWICGLRVRRDGPLPPPRSLLVANHLSWLDIMAVGGSLRSAFIAKAEVADHWLIRWLADQRHTLYVKREDRRGAVRQAAAVRARFDHHLPLTLFAEGTTNDGIALKPFRASLLSAVVPPPPAATVVPVAVDYGANAADIAWHGEESGLDNVKRILSRRRPIRVTIRVLEPLAHADDRKALARDAHDRIEDALGLQSADALDYSGS